MDGNSYIMNYYSKKKCHPFGSSISLAHPLKSIAFSIFFFHPCKNTIFRGMNIHLLSIFVMFFHGKFHGRPFCSRGPRHGKETFRGTECQGGGLPQHGLCRWLMRKTNRRVEGDWNRRIQADELGQSYMDTLILTSLLV